MAFQINPFDYGINLHRVRWLCAGKFRAKRVFRRGSCADFSGGHMPALFTTAFIIISQLTRGVNTFYNTLFPIIGYAGSIITMIWGWALLAGNDVMADEFVAGHVIFGVGMIAACVSTVAASSGHFLLIPKMQRGARAMERRYRLILH